MKVLLLVALAVVAASALKLERYHEIDNELASLENQLEEQPTGEVGTGDDAEVPIVYDESLFACRMDVDIIVDVSGSIRNHPKVLTYSKDFFEIFKKRFAEINSALKSKGLRTNRARIYQFATSVKYASKKSARLYPYGCFDTGAAPCGGDTYTKTALETAMTTGTDKGKRTILLITDGVANPESENPEEYIQQLREEGHNILIAFIGTNGDAANVIEGYTNSQAGMGGFLKFLICEKESETKCKTESVEAAADKVIEELCVQGQDMSVHHTYNQRTYGGGTCEPHPSQSTQVKEVEKALHRGTCELDTNKVYCVGRFSGAAVKSNIDLAIARAKNCRSVFKSKLGWDDSKFKIAWGVVGSGTEDGDCSAQRVDLFCGKGDSSVDIPSELEWKVVS